MQSRVWRFMEEYHMVEDGDRIVAGVSGGADSVALFYLLKSYQAVKRFQLYVVHVNHNLRGEEAHRDEEFVRELCQREEIPCKVYSIDVFQIAAERKVGIEEAGRLARMEAFEQQMRRWGGTKLALAHHGNDLTETVLHHLARGTGLSGLCGIRPVQGKKIRPLLCLERREIEQYLKENEWPFVTDSTNDHEEYTRNRIRRNVVPVLEQQVNPRLVAHVTELAGQLGHVDDYLKNQAVALLERYVTVQEKEAFVQADYSSEEEILCEYGIGMLVEQLAGTRRDLTSHHIRAVMELFRRDIGKIVELPGEYCFEKKYGGILLHPKKSNLPEDRSGELWETVLTPGEAAECGGGIFKTRLFRYNGEEIPEKRYTKWINYDKIDKVLRLRTRRRGDYLVVNRAGGRKKLKDYYIDSKIPRQERDEVMLVALGSEILWVVGYRISEAYKVDCNTKYILEITYKGGEKYVGEDQCADK